MGSLAEVERLSLIFKSLFGLKHKSLILLVFEAMIYLKINASYWNQSMVSEAMCMTKTKRTRERVVVNEDHCGLDGSST